MDQQILTLQPIRRPVPFSLYELGWQDLERGEVRPSHWPERAAGWDAAYAHFYQRAITPR